MIPTNGHKYLVGPSNQPCFFINNTDSDYYQGLTNLTLLRPDSSIMKIELDYRVSLYHWYDTTNDILNIDINLIVLMIDTPILRFNDYDVFKISNNRTDLLFTDTATSAQPFIVDGTSHHDGTSSSHNVLTFIKPLGVGTYDINIAISATYIELYL